VESQQLDKRETPSTDAVSSNPNPNPNRFPHQKRRGRAAADVREGKKGGEKEPLNLHGSQGPGGGAHQGCLP
jgi:hypothetical protein